MRLLAPCAQALLCLAFVLVSVQVNGQTTPATSTVTSSCAPSGVVTFMLGSSKPQQPALDVSRCGDSSGTHSHYRGKIRSTPIKTT